MSETPVPYDIDQAAEEMYRRTLDMFPVVVKRINDQHARWAEGKVSISEVVESMTCKACDKGVALDGEMCQFCRCGLALYPAAADALRFLARQEIEGMDRLIEELEKREARQVKRRRGKTNAE